MLASLGLFNLHELLGKNYCKKVLMCNGASIGHHRKRYSFSLFMGNTPLFWVYVSSVYGPFSLLKEPCVIFLKNILCLVYGSLTPVDLESAFVGFSCLEHFSLPFVGYLSFLLKCLTQKVVYLHHLFWILNS